MPSSGRESLSLRLTEFADPPGKPVYFRLQDLDLAVDDELLSQGGQLR